MAITAFTGPVVGFGQSAIGADYNPDRGPSMFDQGTALLDPRQQFSYLPGQRGGQPFYGFMNAANVIAMDVVPATLAAAGIAAGQVSTANTPLNLITTTALGVTVGTSVVNANTGVLVTGLLAVGGASAGLAFGQSGSPLIWDPTTMLARALSVTALSGATVSVYVVRGYDIYGFPMTENITSVAASTVNGKKAFKYIQSVTPLTSDAAHNITVGTTDIIGFPIRVDTQGYADIRWPEPAEIVSATGFVAAVTTTANATSGDVRGTYALQTASDGTRRMTLFITPSVANISSPAGLFGVTQF